MDVVSLNNGLHEAGPILVKHQSKSFIEHKDLPQLFFPLDTRWVSWAKKIINCKAFWKNETFTPASIFFI
jgi:hypothetical protein